jgi:FkbM family methyltransferase
VDVIVRSSIVLGRRAAVAAVNVRDTAQLILTHPANRGARLTYVARWIRHQWNGRVFGSPNVVAFDRYGLMWAYPHSGGGASRVVYMRRPDLAEMNTWDRLVREGDLFVDIGANVGMYTIMAAALGARVVAVEANPEAVQRLRQNIALNGLSVRVENVAATRTSGVVEMTTTLGAANHLLPAPSISDREAHHEVVGRTLDELLGDEAQVRALKIDVEGFEHDVLLGSTRLLEREAIDVLQVEWNHLARLRTGESRRPSADLLRDLGYKLARPDQDGILVGTDDVEESPFDLFAVSRTFSSDVGVWNP